MFTYVLQGPYHFPKWKLSSFYYACTLTYANSRSLTRKQETLPCSVRPRCSHSSSLHPNTFLLNFTAPIWFIPSYLTHNRPPDLPASSQTPSRAWVIKTDDGNGLPPNTRTPEPALQPDPGWLHPSSPIFCHIPPDPNTASSHSMPYLAHWSLRPGHLESTPPRS